jgi:2-methylcitrate dehydratase
MKTMSPKIRALIRCARKMSCVEDPRYTKEYLDADKRSIANAVQVFFKDGTSTEKVAVEYPIGHRRRRAEGMPLLVKKFEANLASRFETKQREAIMRVCNDRRRSTLHRLIGLPTCLRCQRRGESRPFLGRNERQASL